MVAVPGANRYLPGSPNSIMYRQNSDTNRNPPIHPVMALHMRSGPFRSERWITDIPVVVMPLTDSNKLALTENP